MGRPVSSDSVEPKVVIVGSICLEGEEEDRNS